MWLTREEERSISHQRCHDCQVIMQHSSSRKQVNHSTHYKNYTALWPTYIYHYIVLALTHFPIISHKASNAHLTEKAELEEERIRPTQPPVRASWYWKDFARESYNRDQSVLVVDWVKAGRIAGHTQHPHHRIHVRVKRPLLSPDLTHGQNYPKDSEKAATVIMVWEDLLTCSILVPTCE